MEKFEPYIARDRVIGDFLFDFHIEDKTGMSWYDGSPSQWMPERQWCLDHIEEGFNILDCGAHHGMMTMIFSMKTGKTGRVIAWEALPSNAKVIERNVQLNGLTNVVVKPFGLGSARKNVRCHNNSGNVVIDAAAPDSTNRIEIVTLDEDIESGVRVDFVKIDVEGSDLEMLRGASKVLSQRPIIDLEIHNFLFKDRIKTLKAMFEILAKGNYHYEVLTEIFSSIDKVDGAVDIDWLAQFDNPHVFCVPA